MNKALLIGIVAAAAVFVSWVVLMIGYGMGVANVKSRIQKITEATREKAHKGDISAAMELPGMTRMRALLRSWGASVTVLLCAALLASCGDDAASDAKFIYATCTNRMTLARDNHDSLAVLLACDQLKFLAGVKQEARSANTNAAVASGLSAAAMGYSAGSGAVRVK